MTEDPAHRQDPIVLYTLIELLTHLVFIALVLGMVLRNDADNASDQKNAAEASLERAQAELAAARARLARADAELAQFRRFSKGGGLPPACVAPGYRLFAIRMLAGGGFRVDRVGADVPGFALPPAVEAMSGAKTGGGRRRRGRLVRPAGALGARAGPGMTPPAPRAMPQP